MRSRSDFHSYLASSFPINMETFLYFQPPENVKLKYPCVIYDYSKIQTNHADNFKYFAMHSYSLTLMTKEPDDPRLEIIFGLQYSSFDRHYVVDNLHHYTFIIYY